MVKMEITSVAKTSIGADAAPMKTALVKILVERESTPMRVAPRITALREAHAMDKAAFADSIEFDRSTLSKVEKGKIGLDIAVAERISAIYGVGLDYIYRGDLSDLPLDLRPRVMVELVTARARLTTE